MDALLTWLLTTFDFFASGFGILLIGAIAISMLLVWDWRLFLAGVWIIQLGVSVVVTRLYNVNLEWMQVQMLVMTLCIAMLFLSAQQVRFALPYQRPGSWLVRALAVTLLLICWRLLPMALDLPIVTPAMDQLFFWLGICALIMLGLGDAPLSTGVALLLWLIPVQAFIQLLLPEFRLFVLIGMVQLLSTLACSYLILTARLPEAVAADAPSDVVFPTPTTPLPTLPMLPRNMPREHPLSTWLPTHTGKTQPGRLPLPPQAQPTPPLEGASGEPPIAPRNAS
ncbi:MAG: hypothetical protein KF832_01525 [Caldilineaceae bacterium]|nr:hypothetical protein [Caldilineaceae bacterium]